MVLYYIFVILLYLPVKIFFPVKIVGKKNLPKKTPYVIVSNHLSWVDLLIISINIWGYRRLLAKKEIGKNPIIRLTAKAIGVVLIDRQNIDLTSIRTCIKSLKDGRSLLIFPEGTRNRNGDDLQEVKQGAAMMAIKGGAPIVPAMIYKKQRIFRRNYVYIGEPLSFEEFYGGRLDSEKLAKATELMGKTMFETKEQLENYITNIKQKRSKNNTIAESIDEKNNLEKISGIHSENLVSSKQKEVLFNPNTEVSNK